MKQPESPYINLREQLSLKLQDSLLKSLDLHSKCKNPGARPHLFLTYCQILFECEKCSRKWLTGVGTCKILFSVVGDPCDDSKWLVLFKPKIYKQQCLRRHRKSQPFVLPEDLYQITDDFIDAVEDVVRDGTVWRVPERKEPKKRGKGHHKRELCEACKKGVHKVGRRGRRMRRMGGLV